MITSIAWWVARTAAYIKATIGPHNEYLAIVDGKASNEMLVEPGR
jgi:hypothetical protein